MKCWRGGGKKEGREGGQCGVSKRRGKVWLSEVGRYARAGLGTWKWQCFRGEVVKGWWWCWGGGRVMKGCWFTGEGMVLLGCGVTGMNEDVGDE